MEERVDDRFLIRKTPFLHMRPNNPIARERQSSVFCFKCLIAVGLAGQVAVKSN
jgi:hypothetical protein